MIFIDSNILRYLVGAPHPNKEAAPALTLVNLLSWISTASLPVSTKPGRCPAPGGLKACDGAGAPVPFLWLPERKQLIHVPMDESVPRYLAEIGRRGGRASRRTLDAKTARDTVRVREARRAFRRFWAICFWSYPPDLLVGLGDVPWVARTLMRTGNREAWELGRRLCP